MPVLRIFEHQPEHIITIDDVVASWDPIVAPRGFATATGEVWLARLRDLSHRRAPLSIQMWLAGLLCFNVIKNEDSRKVLVPYAL